MAFIFTTTGTANPVVFPDLGKRSYPHPTTSYDLELEYTQEEVRASIDVQLAIDNGEITVVDAFGNNINDVTEAVSHGELAGLTLDQHSQYALTIGNSGCK